MSETTSPVPSSGESLPSERLPAEIVDRLPFRGALLDLTATVYERAYESIARYTRGVSENIDPKNWLPGHELSHTFNECLDTVMDLSELAVQHIEGYTDKDRVKAILGVLGHDISMARPSAPETETSGPKPILTRAPWDMGQSEIDSAGLMTIIVNRFRYGGEELLAEHDPGSPKDVMSDDDIEGIKGAILITIPKLGHDVPGPDIGPSITQREDGALVLDVDSGDEESELDYMGEVVIKDPVLAGLVFQADHALHGTDPDAFVRRGRALALEFFPALKYRDPNTGEFSILRDVDGRRQKEEIRNAILIHLESQRRYVENRLKRMPGEMEMFFPPDFRQPAMDLLTARSQESIELSDEVAAWATDQDTESLLHYLHT